MKADPTEATKFLQVKEKFGWLHVYISDSNEAIDKLIFDAGSESLHVCEFCGTREQVGSGWVRSWIRTICKPCAVKEYGEEVLLAEKNIWDTTEPFDE
jgi:hypothetical protein